MIATLSCLITLRVLRALRGAISRSLVNSRVTLLTAMLTAGHAVIVLLCNIPLLSQR